MAVVNKKCQVPTPREIVNQMLDQIGYQTNLYGKRILENSCGEGAFLVEILSRYIKDCKRQGKSDAEICEGIQRDIHGYEKDRALHRTCIQCLEETAQKFGLKGIHWNVKRRNALTRIKAGRYQFVIGNPPYLSYPDQDSATRTYLRTHFNSCKAGKPDLYYAFIEASITALAPGGKLTYLVPGNFMKNLYAEALRQFLLPSLCKILNFSHHPLFDGYQTSSVILQCEQNCSADSVEYEDFHYRYTLQVLKTSMKGKWIFENNHIFIQDSVIFSQLFRARAPIATQLNCAYILKDWCTSDNGFITCGKYQIEDGVVWDAAGPNALQRGHMEKIIFPYTYDENGKLLRYEEEEFEKKFPGATLYLKQFLDRLQTRKMDKQARWFEYGRSQLLAHLCQEKLSLSTLVTRQPNVYHLTATTVPYAGICITAEQGGTLFQAQKILESEEFMNYVRLIGVCSNDVTYRISPSDVNAFCFPRKLLED